MASAIKGWTIQRLKPVLSKFLEPASVKDDLISLSASASTQTLGLELHGVEINRQLLDDLELGAPLRIRSSMLENLRLQVRDSERQRPGAPN